MKFVNLLDKSLAELFRSNSFEIFHISSMFVSNYITLFLIRSSPDNQTQEIQIQITSPMKQQMIAGTLEKTPRREKKFGCEQCDTTFR